ncbi:hypothetical protein AHAS_Ahas11G0141900 [Arachis hypogaea]
MPTLKKAKAKLGVPLGVEGVTRQLQIITWACHLKTQAWHANTKEGQSKAGHATWCRRRGTPALNPHLGVPLEDPSVARHTLGVARQFYYPEKRVKHIQGVWHARPWACHASSTFQRREEEGKGLDVPLGLDGVARQANQSLKKTLGMPLGLEGVARQANQILKKTLGVPLGFEGVARQRHQHMGRAT